MPTITNLMYRLGAILQSPQDTSVLDVEQCGARLRGVVRQLHHLAPDATAPTEVISLVANYLPEVRNWGSSVDGYLWNQGLQFLQHHGSLPKSLTDSTEIQAWVDQIKKRDRSLLYLPDRKNNEETDERSGAWESLRAAGHVSGPLTPSPITERIEKFYFRKGSHFIKFIPWWIPIYTDPIVNTPSDAERVPFINGMAFQANTERTHRKLGSHPLLLMPESVGTTPLGMFQIFPAHDFPSLGHLILEKQSHLSDQAVCAIIESVAILHQAQQVHGDLKPDNFIVDPSGTGPQYLCDFDTSRPESETSSRFMGTIPFSSLEQLTGKGITMRDDIFNLGLTLMDSWQSLPDFIRQITNLNYNNLKAALEEVDWNNHLPPHLSHTQQQVLQQALARKRMDRFRSAAQMLEAWREACLTQPPHES